MQLQLILAALYSVNLLFQLILVESHNQILPACIASSKVNYENEAHQENLQNLFDLIVKKNAQKIKHYQKILEHDEVYEQNNFDAMKEELLSIQNRNALKRRNFNEDIAAIKREIPKHNEEPDLESEEASKIQELSQQSSDSSSILNSEEYDEKSGQLPRQDESWETIRRRKRIYVDKSLKLKEIFTNGHKLVLMVRPQRFGKTNILEMIKCFFEGAPEKKHYFDDLKFGSRGNYFNRKYKKWERKKYPIIHLDFREVPHNENRNPTTVRDVKAHFSKVLLMIAKLLPESIYESFNDITILIRELHCHYNLPVVILIDEYDYFLSRAMDINNEDLIISHQRFLDSFLGALKSIKSYLRLAYITGVSNIGMKPISESGPMDSFLHLYEREYYADIMGFTEEELRKNFKLQLEKFVAKYDKDEDSNKESKICYVKENDEKIENIISQIRDFYDGYRFTKFADIRVFNPVSVIECLRNKTFDTFWTRTDSIKNIVKKYYLYSNFVSYSFHSLDNYQIEYDELFQPYDNLESIPLPIYMFHMGYLTIKEYNEKSTVVTLKIVNKEIRNILHKHLIQYCSKTGKQIVEMETFNNQVANSLRAKNTKSAINILQKFGFPVFTDPYDTFSNEYDVTLRLINIFEAGNIQSRYGIKFNFDNDSKKNAGDVDIFTENLPENYIISIKHEEFDNGGSMYAIDQLLGYLKNSPKNFKKAINEPEYAILLALHFQNKNEGTIESWISIPYENGTPIFGRVSASNTALKQKFQNKYISNSSTTDGSIIAT